MFGYGRGNGTTHADMEARDRDGRRTQSRFDNSMTAHAWAQLRQSCGASGNGNFYFRGRTLFSYGPHFAAGYILPTGDAEPGRGVALINADRYSVSTGRHLSQARSAVRGRSFVVPGLTDLARLFESALLRNAVPHGDADAIRHGDSKRDGAGYVRRIDRKAMARDMAPDLKRHFADPDNWPGLDAAAAIFAAASCDAPERRARAALKVMQARRDKAEAKRERDARDALLRDLARYASTDPADMADRIEARAVKAARGRYVDSERASVEEQGRDVFRAIKAGKAAGRTRQAAAARAVYDAIRGNIWRFEAAADRHNRRDAWARNVKRIREGIQAANGGHVSDRGLHGGYASRAARMGAEDARTLAGALAARDGRAWAAPAARLAGHVPTALAFRLSALAVDLERAADRLAREERREENRAKVRALKAARDLSPDAPADVAAVVLKVAADIAERFADETATDTTRRLWPEDIYTGPDGRAYLFRSYRRAPAVFRVAGWNGFRFNRLAAALKARHKAAADALAVMVREREAEARGRALSLWRAGESIPRELAKFTPHAMEDGSAYVRARDVQRDESGAITGGTLETSQGASVPLAHAVRVFRFLKACRDAGKGWKANGRTLRVGLFQVDSVDASGGFVAGCHRFAWEEIAGLARSLGLEEIAPADTTEERGRAHA